MQPLATGGEPVAAVAHVAQYAALRLSVVQLHAEAHVEGRQRRRRSQRRGNRASVLRQERGGVAVVHAGVQLQYGQGEARRLVLKAAVR